MFMHPNNLGPLKELPAYLIAYILYVIVYILHQKKTLFKMYILHFQLILNYSLKVNISISVTNYMLNVLSFP